MITFKFYSVNNNCCLVFRDLIVPMVELNKSNVTEDVILEHDLVSISDSLKGPRISTRA